MEMSGTSVAIYWYFSSRFVGLFLEKGKPEYPGKKLLSNWNFNLNGGEPLKDRTPRIIKRAAEFMSWKMSVFFNGIINILT